MWRFASMLLLGLLAACADMSPDAGTEDVSDGDVDDDPGPADTPDVPGEGPGTCGEDRGPDWLGSHPVAVEHLTGLAWLGPGLVLQRGSTGSAIVGLDGQLFYDLGSSARIEPDLHGGWWASDNAGWSVHHNALGEHMASISQHELCTEGEDAAWAIDDAGGLLTACSELVVTDHGDVDRDLYVARWDASGARTKDRRLEIGSVPHSLVRLEGGAFLLREGHEGQTLLSLGPDLDVRWEMSISTSVQRILPTSEGGFILVESDHSNEMALRLFDAEGHAMWSRELPDARRAPELAIQPSGGLAYLSSYRIVGIDAGLDPLWALELDYVPTHIASNPEGDLLVHDVLDDEVHIYGCR